MRLKRLVGLSLILYVGSVGTVIAIGLWVVPTTQINGLQISAQPAGVGQMQTNGEGISPSTTVNPASQPVNSSYPASSQQQTTTQTAKNSINPTPSPSPGSNPNSNPSPTPAPAPSPTPTPSPAPSPTPTPAPTPTPPPAPSCGSAGGTCTAAQVATHNTQANCWIIYNNGYYIVTSYVNQHPGGKTVFNSNTCGKNISSYLSGSQSTAGQQHSHSGTAYNILNSYYVGPVSG